MPRLAPQQRRQPVGLLIGVVHPVRHGVLVGDPPPGDLEVPAAGVHEQVHPHGPVHRHQPGAGLVIGSVEGNAQRQL